MCLAIRFSKVASHHTTIDSSLTKRNEAKLSIFRYKIEVNGVAAGDVCYKLTSQR